MRDSILLLGAGGHCKSVVDSIVAQNIFSIYGISDRAEVLGKDISGFKVTISDNDLHQVFDSGVRYAFITVGSVGSYDIRVKLYSELKRIGFCLPNIIDPTACISKTVQLGEGVFVGKHAVINTDVNIGSMAIINTGCIIEHDCKISNFVHVAPGAVLLGNVIVGVGTHIGAGTTVIQAINVGNDVLIGAGSVVTKNIFDAGKYYGVPCKKVM